jgi:hypothetical protein
MTTGRAALVATVLVLAFAGCGDASRPATTTQTAAPAAGIDALVARLTAAGPQGQAAPAVAAKTADRQARIVATYVDTLPNGSCRSALEALGASYSSFAAAARSFASGGKPDAYASAAGSVATAFQAVPPRCAAAGG